MKFKYCILKPFSLSKNYCIINVFFRIPYVKVENINNVHVLNDSSLSLRLHLILEYVYPNLTVSIIHFCESGTPKFDILIVNLTRIFKRYLILFLQVMV